MLSGNEIFKPIGQFKGIDYMYSYLISNHGQVVRTYKNGKEQPIKQFIANGYYFVKLWKNGKSVNAYIHSLVAHAYLVNPVEMNFDSVDHKDGDKLNNSWWNLRHMYLSDNISIANSGVSRERKRYPATSVIIARHIETRDILRLAGRRDVEQAGFSFRMVSLCCSGESVSHKGWTFIDTGIRIKRSNERIPYSDRFVIKTPLGRFIGNVDAARAHKVTSYDMAELIRNPNDDKFINIDRQNQIY